MVPRPSVGDTTGWDWVSDTRFQVHPTDHGKSIPLKLVKGREELRVNEGKEES